MFRAALLLGILPTVFGGTYHCPITHPWVYTDNLGNDYCCSTADDDNGNADIHYLNPKTSKSCKNNDYIPCKVRNYFQTCTSYDFGDTCPSTNPWVYRPTANLDYCCASSTDSAGYKNSNSGPYDWRFNNCKDNANFACADPPCSDFGKLEGYQGCYVDNATRDLSVWHGAVSGLTQCKALAKQAGYQYYSMQWNYQCFYGDNFGTYGEAEDSECNRLTFDQKNFTGGSYRNSVYSTEAPQLVTCKGSMDDQVFDVFADGVRLPIKGSHSYWNHVWEIQFLDTTQRISIRGYDGQKYGVVSGGLSFSCSAENEDSKWHGLYSHPRFTQYVRGYGSNSSETANPPFRYMDADYDLDSAPADFQFKPVFAAPAPTAFEHVADFGEDIHRLSAGFNHYQTFVIQPPSVDNYPESPSNYECELSSVHNGHVASKCCSGEYGINGTDDKFCHAAVTAIGKTNPWVQIDLGSEKFVHGLYTLNRNNSSAGIRERFGEHEVYVGNDPSYLNNDLCGTGTADGSTYASFVKCAAESRGRYVTLVLPGTDRILNVDELIPYTTSGDHITSTYNYVNPSASLFPKEFYLKDDKFTFTADVTPNGISEGALLLSRGNAGEGLTILSLKAGVDANELQLMGQDTGKILETGTTYNIQVRRVVHDSGDVVALYVDGVYVAEQAVSFNDNESSTTAEGGAFNFNGKAPWAVGAGLYTAESKGTIQATLEENRVYSACFADDCGQYGRSMLNSVQAWSTTVNNNWGNDSLTFDLLSEKTVVGFAVQGRHDYAQTVQEFEATYSKDNISYSSIRTQENRSSSTIKGSPTTLDQFSDPSERDVITETYVFPVEARYVRIVPKVCFAHCSMRVDVIAIDELNYNDRNFKAFNGSINNAQFQVLAEEATRAPTPEPTAHPTIAEGNVVCGSANEIVFNTFYHTVGGSYHVSLDTEVNGVDFSVSGPEGVNIALLDSSVTPDASTITQGFTGGYDIYLGARNEPFAHISGTFGGTPEAAVHLHDDDIVHESESRDYSITVDGSVVTIYKGHSHRDDKVALLSHDFGSAKTVDYAVFAYGYGDLECQES